MERYNPVTPDPAFVAWVISINKGWRERTNFEPFNEYVKQCDDWIKDPNKPDNYTVGTREWVNAVKIEGERVAVNSLYYMKAYNYFVDASVNGGKRKTTTCESQDVLCFLLDYGCSMLIAKARGIRSTSTFLPIAGIKSRVVKNMRIQYVCSSDSKAKKLFAEKVKMTTQNDPLWLRPSVGNDTLSSIEYYRKNKKGERSGMNTSLFINAPNKDVVNAINPDLVLVDEGPSIPIFSTMLQEARPALYTHTGEERKQTKQFIGWGSSQVDDDDVKQISDEFEKEWKALYESFQKGVYDDGVVPIFFDCWAIPGLKQEDYDREQRIAIGKKTETALIRFRKHYPTSPEDVFLRNVDTIIPFEHIQAQLEIIYKGVKSRDLILQRGYFNPVYDKSKPLPPEIGSPYKIIGAEFMPLDDTQINLSTVVIYKHPQQNWVNRYYQGTDPIKGATGHSKFASCIWDNADIKEGGKTIAAILNCRHTNYHKDYEQAYCLHLYYSNANQNHFIPELLEINDGSEYNNYCEMMNFGYNMIANMELPDYLRTGAENNQIIGIRKTSNNAPKILRKTQDLLLNYKDRIMIDDLWIQAKTYVRHQNAKNYQDSYKPADKYCFDDVLDGATFSYVATLSREADARQINTEKDFNTGRRRKVLRDGVITYEDDIKFTYMGE